MSGTNNWLKEIAKHKNNSTNKVTVFTTPEDYQEIEGEQWMVNDQGDKLKCSDFEELVQSGEAFVVG